jgi:hypothetical protein
MTNAAWSHDGDKQRPAGRQALEELNLSGRPDAVHHKATLNIDSVCTDGAASDSVCSLASANLLGHTFVVLRTWIITTADYLIAYSVAHGEKG